MLTNKVAIVTGAGRGIGRAVSLRLARDGADVVAADIDLATAESTAKEVAAIGRRSLAVQLDVSDQAAAREKLSRAVADMGRVDILVNNAGIVQAKSWLELTNEDIDRMFAINVKGIIFCSQAIADHLTSQRSGRVINMASVAAKIGRPLYAHYSASKAAVVNVTRALAMYFAPYGITCNSVCPGFVDTKMWEYLDEELGRIEGRPKGETFKQRVSTIPLGRAEVPDDVASVVSFLASDDSSYMTGQSLVVDGGVFME
ncbi:MAG: glucose 1-dehydrogenase [Dehalococcoidales bacterium]|nr:glucose 1-dehydrogenase [Dehalococcoidales bacterium]